MNGKRKKKNKREIPNHASGSKLEKPKKNTFVFTSVITGNLLWVLLCVGSWGHIAQENKGEKNSKTTGLQKNQERERDHPVKEKKNVIQKS